MDVKTVLRVSRKGRAVRPYFFLAVGIVTLVVLSGGMSILYGKVFNTKKAYGQAKGETDGLEVTQVPICKADCKTALLWPLRRSWGWTIEQARRGVSLRIVRWSGRPGGKPKKSTVKLDVLRNNRSGFLFCQLIDMQVIDGDNSGYVLHIRAMTGQTKGDNMKSYTVSLGSSSVLDTTVVQRAEAGWPVKIAEFASGVEPKKTVCKVYLTPK